MQKLCAAAGWLLALAIVVLSVVPPTTRPTTGSSSNLEHFAIYLLAGFAFCLGYATRPLIVTMGLLAFSGIVEIAQLWVPGRHARLSDFVIDGVAACIGVAIAMIAEKLIRSRRKS